MTFFFFSWTLIQSFRIQLKKKIANIWQNKRGGIIISEVQFEAVQIHFWSDVFVAVPIVVA